MGVTHFLLPRGPTQILPGKQRGQEALRRESAGRAEVGQCRPGLRRRGSSSSSSTEREMVVVGWAMVVDNLMAAVGTVTVELAT